MYRSGDKDKPLMDTSPLCWPSPLCIIHERQCSSPRYCSFFLLSSTSPYSICSIYSPRTFLLLPICVRQHALFSAVLFDPSFGDHRLFHPQVHGLCLLVPVSVTLPTTQEGLVRLLHEVDAFGMTIVMPRDTSGQPTDSQMFSSPEGAGPSLVENHRRHAILWCDNDHAWFGS